VLNIFNNTRALFKKRRPAGYLKTKLDFGNLGLKFDKNYTFEKLHLLFLKKKLKFFLKKKLKNQNMWFFLIENFSVFKKGKNSRMGKGKGIFQRKSYMVKKNKKFLEFLNLNVLFLKKISYFFKKFSNLKTSTVIPYKQGLIFYKTNLSFYKLYYRF